MSVVFLAVGTTRARSVCDTSAYLLDRGVDVGLVTVEPAAWQQAGLDPRVRLYPLGDGEQRHPLARLGRAVRKVNKALDTKIYSKVYRLLRPYVMWRVARRSVLRQIEWAGVEQLVIGDSHAIPIGWHLARRHPQLPVGFELDRAPYAEAEQAASAEPAGPAASEAAAVPAPRGAEPPASVSVPGDLAVTTPTTESAGIDTDA
jgi:hypothetical protein